MNYQKVIDRTLQLQSKIVKACGRNFGSLKNFNSKYVLEKIDFENKTAKFDLLLDKDGDYSLYFNFKLIRTEGRRINHTVEVTLIK